MLGASHFSFSLSPVAYAVSRLTLCILLGLVAAESRAAEPVDALPLKSVPMLAEEVPGTSENRGPTFVSGTRVSGRPDLETIVEGHAELRRGATVLRADRIEYFQPTDLLTSQQNVRINHNGTRLDALVLSPRAAELHALMPYKAPPDMSRFVLSPMPGLLVEVAVQVGQKVQTGERIAVIEAMKMENVLFATADGVVGKILANKGESLSVDQPIVEFV